MHYQLYFLKLIPEFQFINFQNLCSYAFKSTFKMLKEKLREKLVYVLHHIPNCIFSQLYIFIHLSFLFFWNQYFILYFTTIILHFRAWVWNLLKIWCSKRFSVNMFSLWFLRCYIAILYFVYLVSNVISLIIVIIIMVLFISWLLKFLW